ncbi:Site-specific DNA recombinase [Marinobacter sp. es.042]|uniref:recombinase family protein n=1 Tax=Marinobacter sp. es.042 TaxID=1761794 RepID=UPI000B50F82D|nr:recombinase family protein [Marinobacter sp. es.042]SNB59173.1 Site-specific DNA recombinase [Marinobacter sp. es.042]|tara:strand:+ start:3195 stop:3818 length:624 start_codon:yes stop_codon:yes gene_type:complete
MHVRAYLRASTKEQDANRARNQIEEFASERGLVISAWYLENESGASLQRPELFRLLNDCSEGDVLLVEQVDRLSRLNAKDWAKLKTAISEIGVRVVALDLPTSWMMMSQNDELTSRMMDALNTMMLDMLAAIARKDYADRRRRQAEGIARAKADGKYRGRPSDYERHKLIFDMINRGMTWSQVSKATGASRSTISRVLRDCRGSVTG